MRCQSHGTRSNGFTVIELMAAIALLGTLAALAIPAFTGYTERARINAAVGEIGRVTVELHRWRMANGDGTFPDTLADADIDMAKDPWGNDYVYEDIATAATPRTHGGDDVNTEFDLYSKGPDGSSATSLTHTSSLDDIVYARDGAFLGKAEHY